MYCPAAQRYRVGIGMKSCACGPDDVELPGQLLAIADALVIGLPGSSIFRGYHIEYGSAYYRFAIVASIIRSPAGFICKSVPSRATILMQSGVASMIASSISMFAR